MANEMDFIEIEILNWEKYNPRKDYVKPWWFALSNTITSDPMFSEFTDSEFRAWIHLLCTASVQKSPRIQVFPKHVKQSAGIKRDILLATIDKLEILKVIQLPAGFCTEPVRNLVATEHHKTEQNTTRQECGSGDPLPDIAVTWNAKVVSLPKVKAWTKARARMTKAIVGTSETDWVSACEKVEASDFLSGRNHKWTSCSFDWLLKPANLTKVLEGNYDNRGGPKGDVDFDKVFGRKEGA